jgi:outer membrane protein insertion porin family
VSIRKSLKKKSLKNVILSILLILCSTIGAQGEGEIRKVRFTGNDHFSDKELREQISFKPTTWLWKKIFKNRTSYYSDEALDMNVRELIHFYQSEGFLSAEIGQPVVDTHGRKKKVEIKINIIEGKPIIIDSIEFDFQNNQVHTELLSADEIRKLRLSAKKGKQFRDEMIWADSELISHFFINRGYPYAMVAPEIKVDSVQKKASVIWEIKPGPLGYFGEITISGNKRTPKKTILRQIAFKPGEIYSREKLNKSQQQIYQLGTFRVASIKALLSKQQDDTIPVNIVFTEAPATSTRLGIGYGREDKLRGFIDFQLLNFTGGARRLNIYLKHSSLEPYRIETTLTQPGAFSPNSTLAFSPSVRKLNEPGYELLTYGANISLLQKITEKLSGSLNWYYDKVILDTTTVAKSIESYILPKSYSKSGIAVGVIYFDAEPRFDPSKGWSIAFNTKINSVLFDGKYPFVKNILEIKNYQSVGSDVILASKIRTGFLHPIKGVTLIPVEERFFAGGSRSVRGWARQKLGPTDDSSVPLGGNALLEISFEPRINIYGPLSMIVFMDAGNVWLDADEFSFKDIRFSAGAGLRYSTPIGPVGIDFARPIFDETSKWQFHINIGHAF